MCGVSPEKLSPCVTHGRIRFTVQFRLIQKFGMACASW